MRPSDIETSVPRLAAAVLLARDCPGGGAELFFLRRRRGASFLSGAFVFPGGAAEPAEEDLRVAAARELFEEAGVLIARPVPAPARLAAMRRDLHRGDASFAALLAAENAAVSTDELHYFAHWITPSIEKKRFSAQFFVARLPSGQTPSCDHSETVADLWATPKAALDRSTELRLPPPQVRTLFDLLGVAERGVAAVVAEAKLRAQTPHPILPRLRRGTGAITLLLPWDPEYVSAGLGAALPMPTGHPLAVGPSRFILENGTWKQVFAPIPSPAA